MPKYIWGIPAGVVLAGGAVAVYLLFIRKKKTPQQIAAEQQAGKIAAGAADVARAAADEAYLNQLYIQQRDEFYASGAQGPFPPYEMWRKMTLEQIQKGVSSVW
jgi:hypothetical protein